MPIKRFWLMNTQIDRISAQRDLRALTLTNVAQSEESAKNHREHLNREIGTLVVGAPERDEKGFNELHKMMYVQ